MIHDLFTLLSQDIRLRSTKSTLGTIEHATEWSFPHYFIRDSGGHDILQVVGPSSPGCFSFSVDSGNEFSVLLPDGKTFVGKIAKYRNTKESGGESGALKSDIWGVKFPLEMDVTHKALLLGACFLLVKI